MGGQTFAWTILPCDASNPIYDNCIFRIQSEADFLAFRMGFSDEAIWEAFLRTQRPKDGDYQSNWL
jgi:hypothetical protein